MSSKSGKTDENLKDRLKSFFRINKDKSSSAALQKPSSREFIFTPELLKDIGPESPGNNRIKTIKELGDVVLKKELEENAIEAAWCSIQDLVLPQVVSEKRHVALHFLQCLLEGQYHNLGILRHHFFNVIQSLTVKENLPERLALFKILSENGRNLVEFEEETGVFLLEWMPDVVEMKRETDFLPLLNSVIKYNAAYLDEDILCGIVKQTCNICNKHHQHEQIKLSLDVLDSVVCYSYLPTDCLHHFVGALCRMVNLPQYSEQSWELMRKLLGTHLGHSSIGTMCTMLQDRTDPQDFQLLRGAIFYIGMALWGSRKVPLLKHTPAVVLPSFRHVLSAGSPIIAHEVILSVQRLVKKYGKELTHSTWNLILDILETVLKDLRSKHLSDPLPTEVVKTQNELHDILSTIEQLNEQGHYCGSVSRLFKIIELCAAKRPETSVIHLITYDATSINPSKENWVGKLYMMLEKYFRNEKRTKIRLKALDVLAFVLSVNKHMYEEDLIHSVVLPHLCHLEMDEDSSVRKLGTEILLSLLQSCSLVAFMDIIDIVEKVICRPLSLQYPQHLSPTTEDKEKVPSTDESHLADVKAAIHLLVELYKVKLYNYPPGVGVKLYDMLVSHLSAHYCNPRSYNSHTAAIVRKNITECLLELRADGFYHLGFFQRASDRPLRYSPYITCNKDVKDTSPPRSPVTTVGDTPAPQWSTLTYVDYSRAFSVFIQCLETEKDWEVLKCVLENLPILLQNKTLILSARFSHIDMLSGKLCAMVSDRQLGYPEKLQSMPGKFTRSDFHAYVFPVLAAMVTYHNYLDRGRQRELIKCLEFGMVSKCAKLCVNALRLCTLEMQDSMMRLLPSVLLQLSKISATVAMAIPVLAFLSSIVRLPKMYANFVEDEYMSVFAIALPYTNPFKFSHYTVSLAHHVIAIWFIRCRLPFRKGFVQFIQKGLKANVLQQFEENAKQVLQNQNEDSSERGRSESYSEAALRRARGFEQSAKVQMSMSTSIFGAPGNSYPATHNTCCDVCKQCKCLLPTTRGYEQSAMNYSNRRRMQSGSAVNRLDVHTPMDEKRAQFHRELTETCTDMMSRYSYGNYSALPHRSHIAAFLLAGGQSKTWLVGNKLFTITTSGGGTKVGNSGVCEKCQATYQAETRERTSSVRRRHKSAVAFSRSSSTLEPSQLSSQDDSTIQQRSSRDDMSLDLGISGQDVGVQTGSSLSDSTGMGENEPLESFILGMKSNDPRRNLLNVCNCWCTNWAEIYIRAPSGNTSWMMRIENESGMYTIQDSQMPDITMLLASMSKKHRPPVTRQNQRIDSGSIGEEEYESLYAQHFPDYLKPQDKTEIKTTPSPLAPIDESHHIDAGNTSNVAIVTESDSASMTHEVSPALQIPSSESAKNHDGQFSSGGSLRRSNSSPSILSGSSDTLSPRESISDIVQIGQLIKDDSASSGSVKKSVESDLDKLDKSKSIIQPSGQEVSLVGSASKDSADGLSISKAVDVASQAQAVEGTDDKNDHSEKPTQIHVLDQTGVKLDSASSVPNKDFTSMLTKQLSPSPASSESSTQDEVGELPANLRRRGHTIAVMASSAGSQKESNDQSSSDSTRVGINPSFVFLQLYHTGQISLSDAPLLLPNSETTERSIMLLDHIYPYETHKIGVIYVGPNQPKDEKAILCNEFGSDRYMKFIQSLGTLFRLRDCDKQRVYLGGLNTNGSDGEFTYGWHDESTQLVFHIATLMPNRKSDPNGNAKKLHIGNDYVTVVYNDSGEDYRIGVIKGQFNYVNIVIKPLDYESNAVTLQAKEDIAGILGHTDTKIISDTNLAGLVRQIAIHCNLASMVLQRQQSQPQDPFANNWLERLRKIRRMRTTLVDTSTHSPDSPPSSRLEDFTQFV